MLPLPTVDAVEPSEVDRTGLPPIVRAFAERALAGKPELPDKVEFTQAAEMKLRPDAAWTKVPARQAIGIGAPAFAWDAWAEIAPLIGIRVIDAYVGGEGRLKVRLLGSIPLATATGPEVTYAELFRYLAELALGAAGHPRQSGAPLACDRRDDGRGLGGYARRANVARVRLIFDAGGRHRCDRGRRPAAGGGRPVRPDRLARRIQRLSGFRRHPDFRPMRR